MQVSQEKLLQYIHFNRQYNTLLIEHNTKLINQLRMEMDTVKPTQPSTQLEVEPVQPQGAQVILVRKEADNPVNYFDKTYQEYQDGFSANGL